MNNQIPTTQTATVDSNSGVVGQFLRFAVVGLINSVINFAVLNLLSHFTKITSGPGVIAMGAVAFAAATVNSYFMNKNWSFKDHSHFHEGQKFAYFLMVSIIGLVINSLTVYAVTTFISPPEALITAISGNWPLIGHYFTSTSVFWLNFANVVAICLALIWNFYGYRKFVFKPV